MLVLLKVVLENATLKHHPAFGVAVNNTVDVLPLPSPAVYFDTSLALIVVTVADVTVRTLGRRRLTVVPRDLPNGGLGRLAGVGEELRAVRLRRGLRAADALAARDPATDAAEDLEIGRGGRQHKRRLLGNRRQNRPV